LKRTAWSPPLPIAVWRTGPTRGRSGGVSCPLVGFARSFERMPVLADALMDAGCNSDLILGKG
jgi:hypothetical protein